VVTESNDGPAFAYILIIVTPIRTFSSWKKASYPNVPPAGFNAMHPPSTHNPTSAPKDNIDDIFNNYDSNDLLSLQPPSPSMIPSSKLYQILNTLGGGYNTVMMTT